MVSRVVNISRKKTTVPFPDCPGADHIFGFIHPPSKFPYLLNFVIRARTHVYTRSHKDKPVSPYFNWNGMLMTQALIGLQGQCLSNKKVFSYAKRMFATLDLESNMSILDKSDISCKVTDKGKKNHNVFFRNSKSAENKRLGINSRSRKGCKECKRRKRRCDEIKPSCGRCLKTGIPCVWPEFKQEPQKSRNKQQEPNQLELVKTVSESSDGDCMTIDPNSKLSGKADIHFEDLDSTAEIRTLEKSFLLNSCENAMEEQITESTLNMRNIIEQSDREKQKNSFLLESLKQELGKRHYTTPFFEITLNTFPSQKLLFGLKDTEVVYLDYYRTCVSQTISILPKESNFFLSLYLPLAENNKSILYALIGWAGVFLNDESNQHIPLDYIKKSVILSKQELGKEPTKSEKLAIFSLYTILCAVLICAGDVKEWYKYFKTLHKFLLDQSNGDLKEIKNCMGDFKETKWLVSNFLYHDVLASISHIEGTCFTMAEYCQILDITMSDPEFVKSFELSATQSGSDKVYGSMDSTVSENYFVKNNANEIGPAVIDNDLVCDPLQGCVRPVFLLIGEITNTFVKLKNAEKRLKELEEAYKYEEFSKARNKVYSQLEKKYESLQTLLKNTKPHAMSLCYLKSDKDLEHHLTLFEAFRLSALIYLKTLVKKIPPASPEIQILVVELLPCISIILGSKVQASLCFPLLVAGMSCISKCDRSFIAEKVLQMSNSFPVKNFQRILVIIEHTWKINKEGLKCVYWFEISTKFGWALSLA